MTVASTPDGRADAIRWQGSQAVFALPYEEQLSLSTVLQNFQQEQGGQAKDRVFYVQAQNNSLNTEFPALLKDVDSELPWASTAFGCSPEAVNIWIGDHRSVTSFHRDHYENMYAVVAGTKRFTLLPPCERYRMHMMQVPAAVYRPQHDGSLDLELERPERLVSWCPIEVAQDDVTQAKQVEAYPRFHDPSLPAPLTVQVHAGEILYLPSMWYHMVQQEDDDSGRVIAVNYWYDMQYDCKYAYAKLIEHLSG